MLGFQHDGVADVKVEYVGRAPLEGDDTPMLMASYRPGNAPAINDGLPSGVMIASRQERSPFLMAAAFSGRRPQLLRSRRRRAPCRLARHRSKTSSRPTTPRPRRPSRCRCRVARCSPMPPRRHCGGAGCARIDDDGSGRAETIDSALSTTSPF